MRPAEQTKSHNRVVINWLIPVYGSILPILFSVLRALWNIGQEIPGYSGEEKKNITASYFWICGTESLSIGECMMPFGKAN
jgi:hypothetical protein